MENKFNENEQLNEVEILDEEIDTQKETLEEENVIMIMQTLTKEDMYNMNMEFAKKSKSYFTLVVGIIAIAYSIYQIIINKEKGLPLNIFMIALGTLGVLFHFFLAKMIVVSKVKKTEFSDLEPMIVSISEKGILCRYESEEPDLLPYDWKLIRKVVNNGDYLVIYTLNRQVSFIVKISCITDIEFIPFMKKQLGSKYVERYTK